MSSKETAAGPSCPKVEKYVYLPSMVNLLRFLNQYLDPYTMRSIEEKAKQFALFPEMDTKFFVKKVEMAVTEKMMTVRFELREVLENLMSNRLQLMERLDRWERRPRCSWTASAAALELIDGLKGAIPEAKRSNWRNKASHATEENFGDFLNELEEDLMDFLGDKERTLLARLNKRMEDFRNDLFSMSKQLRMVSKICLAIEAMEGENIEKNVKQDIMNKGTAIVKNLKLNLVSPSVAKDIFQLTNMLKTVSSSTKRFKKAVKALEATAVYLCGDID